MSSGLVRLQHLLWERESASEMQMEPVETVKWTISVTEAWERVGGESVGGESGTGERDGR